MGHYKWLTVLVLFIETGTSNIFAQTDSTSTFETTLAVGELVDKTLKEASGLAVSSSNAGYFWTHNDSGDSPHIYLIDSSGTLHLTVKLDSAIHIDWEDIASCSIDGENFLFIGDIGDNMAKRNFLMIYKVKEPEWDGEAKSMTVSNFETMIIQYAEGARDAETLMVDPNNNQLLILSKRDKNSQVYQFDFAAGEMKTISSLGKMPISGFTAGDISTNGDILIKNYTKIFLYSADQGKIASEVLLKNTYKKIPYKPEPQGESIVWNAAGTGFYTVSEKRFNTSKQVIYFHSR